MALVFHKVVSIEEALEILEEKLGGLKPIGVEYVSIDEAYGRILAEDVYAVVDSPPFDR
ncbi:MAG: molybdopterin biosynthesis protein, partial [Nitrososphaerota archaeon]